MEIIEANSEIKSIVPFSEGDIAFFACLIAAIIALWGIYRQWAISKRQHTFNHLSKMDADKDMIAARAKFIELSKSGNGLVQYSDPTHAGSDEVEKIRLVLNDLELTAIGVQKNIIDLDLVIKYQRGLIIKYWEKAAPFVYAVRSRSNSNKIYHEFEELARLLDSKNQPPRRFKWFSKFFW